MSRLKVCAVIAALAAGNVASSFETKAADLPEPPAFPAYVEQVQEFGSGWYIRGDLGYRSNRVDGAFSALADIITADSIDNAAVFGLGGGYKATWLRADLTIDYSGRANFAADTPDGASVLTTKIETVTTLANLYADLGNWNGVTPYVGAGLGFSYMRAREFYDATISAPAAANNDNWNFAWAAIGGLSYRIGTNLLADASYRWLHLGDLETGVDAAGNRLTVEDIAAHEFRFGLRYELD